MTNKDGFKISYALSLAAQLGFIIIASIAGFVVLGDWIDSQLGTSPLFLISGIFVGIGITIYEAYHMLKPLLDESDKL